MASEPGKGRLAAGEDNDLLGAGLAMQRVEHRLDAVVVEIDSVSSRMTGVGCPPPGEQPCEGQSRRIAATRTCCH